MDNCEMEYADGLEEDVRTIREAALKKARLTDPKIPYVIDSRSLDDYCYKTWDYPGKWYYSGFRLPDGFHSKNELIDAIAADTIRHFGRKKK